MSPEAIRHYIHWLSHKWTPVPFYSVLGGMVALVIMLVGELGDNPGPNIGVLRRSTVVLVPMVGGALLAGGVYVGVRLGTWTAFSRLESGSEGHERELWYLLMTKYRGLRADVVDSARFRGMLLRSCEYIVRHEKLTAEQQQWVSELMALAALAPRLRHDSFLESVGYKHGERITIVVLVTILAGNLIRLIMLLLER